MNGVNNLLYTSWNYKYYIAFVVKCRRKVFYIQKRRKIRAVLRTLCNWMKGKSAEAEVYPDNIYILVEKTSKILCFEFYRASKKEKQPDDI